MEGAGVVSRPFLIRPTRLRTGENAVRGAAMTLLAPNLDLRPCDFLPKFGDVGLQLGDPKRIKRRRHEAGSRPWQVLVYQVVLLS